MMGGALGAEGSAHIIGSIDAAMRADIPVIGLWHSGGAKLADGVGRHGNIPLWDVPAPPPVSGGYFHK